MQIVYREMDQPTLDAAYNNVKAAPDFARTYADCQARSAALYAARPCTRNIAYGPLASQRFDWFPCAQAAAPTFVFVHGGYWQHCSKEDFAYVAEGALANGFHVAVAEYTLAPQATMTQIVAEIGSLLDHLAADREGLGTAGRPLCLSGHSAGGHLAALHRSHRAVSHAMPISALVDLEPISRSWLNDKLSLSAQEISRFSPIRRIGPGAPMVVSVGAAELPELVRHSSEYAAACQAAGEAACYLAVQACDHFSVLDDLACPTGIQMAALAALTGIST